MKSREHSSVLSQLTPYMGLGGELAGTTLGATGLGWLLDSWFGTTPWLLAIFSALGGLAAMSQFIRRVLKQQKQKSQPSEQQETQRAS